MVAGSTTKSHSGASGLGKLEPTRHSLQTVYVASLGISRPVFECGIHAARPQKLCSPLPIGEAIPPLCRKGTSEASAHSDSVFLPDSLQTLSLGATHVLGMLPWALESYTPGSWHPQVISDCSPGTLRSPALPHPFVSVSADTHKETSGLLVLWQLHSSAHSCPVASPL